MRYLPLTDSDRRSMLDTIGAASIDDLFSDIPPAARLTAPLDLPTHQGELEVQRSFEEMAAKNLGPARALSFLGAGLYRHHVPATVDYLIQRGEFLTAYTPYQPEVSQGTLQALFEFQTQVALITDMDVANASMYDGATACSEAVMMAARVSRRAKAILSGGLHPHYREVTETMAALLGVEIDALAADWRGPGGPEAEDLIGRIDDETACVVVQNPGFFGHLNDYTAVAEACHEKGALLVFVVTECMSLGALTPPGAMGADIIAAEGQALGNATSFGGPTVGLMAAHQKHVRQMPGRLVGETVDADGRRGFVLTLSTREQHIRREKATSNICTNSGLCALAFTIHLTLLGEEGLRQLAALNHAAAVTAADRLASVPAVEVINQTFFNEFTVRLPVPAAPVVDALAERGILAGVPASRLYPDDDDVSPLLLVALTEANGDDDADALASALEEVL